VQGDYRVQLEAFEGPLDLLLYLIRRHEVDVHDIPVATIAEQYVAFLASIERLDIEQAGEFLVMAATLMEIKSRIIAADLDDTGDEDDHAAQKRRRDEGDPRLELVEQLLAYKRHRDAADMLEHQRATWESRFPVRPIGVHAEDLRAALEQQSEALDDEDVSLTDLIAAFERIAESVNLTRLGEHEVVSDDTPIELHAEDIVDRLKREQETGGQLSLFGVLQGRTRAEMVGLLLAMLDLVRQQRLHFRQNQGREGVGDSILLELREPEPAEDAAVAE
jgi:segregation and condensation protein A